MWDWVSSRFRAIDGILGFRRYLLIPAVGTGVGILDAVAKKVSELSVGEWLGIPSWAFGTLFALSMIVFWAIEKVVSLNDKLTPKIRVSFDHNRGCLIQSPIKKKEKDGDLKEVGNGTYLRILVENTSSVLATFCQAYIINIERRLDNGTLEQTEFTDAIELRPVTYGIAPTWPFVIPGKMQVYFEVIYARSTDNWLGFHGGWPLTLRDLFAKPGKFRLTVAVTSSGITQQIKIDIIWNGHWDGLSAVHVA